MSLRFPRSILYKYPQGPLHPLCSTTSPHLSILHAFQLLSRKFLPSKSRVLLLCIFLSFPFYSIMSSSGYSKNQSVLDYDDDRSSKSTFTSTSSSGDLEAELPDSLAALQNAHSIDNPHTPTPQPEAQHGYPTSAQTLHTLPIPALPVNPPQPRVTWPTTPLPSCTRDMFWGGKTLPQPQSS